MKIASIVLLLVPATSGDPKSSAGESYAYENMSFINLITRLTLASPCILLSPAPFQQRNMGAEMK